VPGRVATLIVTALAPLSVSSTRTTGVGAVGQRRAGHDAHRLAADDRPRRDRARGDIAHDHKAPRHVGHVGADDRVPIHRRVAERRYVAVSDDVFCEGGAERIQEVHGHRLKQPDLREDPFEGLIDGQRMRGGACGRRADGHR